MQKGLFVFDTSVDPARLASFCVESGIDSVILHPGFFENDSFLSAARRAGVRVWLNLPVFYDEKYLSENPGDYSVTNLANRGVHSWLHMVCPSRAGFMDGRVRQLGDLIERIGPDFISFDFLRFFVFWEEVDLSGSPDAIEHGCYCPQCLDAYRSFSGERLSITDGVVAPAQRRSLGEWKESVIAATARRLTDVVASSAGGTPISVKTIPWRAADLDHALSWVAGQNVLTLSGLSLAIIPMAFAQIVGRTPAWKRQLLDDVQAISGRKVMSYVQFEPLIRPGDITGLQLDAEIQAAIDEDRSGLVYFHYEQIMANPEKQSILARYRTL